MLIKISGGKVYDPVHGIDGQKRDIYIRDGRIVAKPGPDEKIHRTYQVNDRIVMAGAIDIHTHIGGGKVNIARMLLPEDHRAHPVPRTALTRSGSGYAAPSTLTTGYRYAAMGYTACFEPAMLPANARQAHMELADTPIIDKGAYAMLGNDDFFLRLLQARKPQAVINNYVAWILHATQALAIKVVNPGGISAFKFNQRSLDLDEQNRYYGVTPRQVLKALSRAVHDLGVPHPLHVHGCNLGVPGSSSEAALKTIEGSDGVPLHLAHQQFHSYGCEGDYKFSSDAARIAEAVNKHKHVSIDVGQVMFEPTVTVSGDTMAQYRNRGLAKPNKWVSMDIECEAGCGVVPFRYRDRNFVNALQWCVGLELFLLVEDPWRIFLTTDHPNGASFAAYPRLIRLLMDRSYRNDMLAAINPAAARMSTVGSITREYSLYEIAIMTRAAPARSLGLLDRGHLGPGAVADITVYRDLQDREQMFARPEYVFKNGVLIAQDGEITQVLSGATHVVKPEYDPAIERELREYFERYHTVRLGNFKLSGDEITEAGGGSIVVQPCRPEAKS